MQPDVPELGLDIAPADLATLEADVYADVPVPCVATYGGAKMSATCRYRGQSTRDLPQRSYKVSLAKGYQIDGRDKFELLAEYRDGGKLEEKWLTDLYEALHLTVPHARYVTITLNGKNNGLYVDMEHVGGAFLWFHSFEPGSTIYRCGGRNCEMKAAPPGPYQDDFTQDNNAALPNTDLKELLRAINLTDDADFEAQIEQKIDLDAYLGELAVEAFMSALIVEDMRPYWVHELTRDRWTYVPWDLSHSLLLQNRTWAITDPPISTTDLRVFSLYDPQMQDIYNSRVATMPGYRATFSVLNTRIWDRPRLRERLIGKIQALLDGPLAGDKPLAHFQALRQRVLPSLLADPFVDTSWQQASMSFYTQYVEARRSYLLSTGIPAAKAHGSGPLVINELGFGANAYVELYNRSDTNVDLSGLVLTNDLRNCALYSLPAGLSLPAHGHLVFTADAQSGATHLPFTLSTAGGEVGLFDGTKRVFGALDAVYFGPHADGTAYGRVSDGADDFAVQAPTPGQPNP